MHGSPIFEARNEEKNQITSAIPLEWNNELFNNTKNEHELVIYDDFKLGKRLKLDESYILSDLNYLKNQIIKYETTFTTPTNLADVHIEIPTGYLTPDFNRFFEIDATQSDLNQG